MKKCQSSHVLHSLQFKFLPLLVLIGLVMMTTACQQTVKISDIDLKTIDYKKFNTLLLENKDDQVVVVDVRKPEKFNQGHIPGAINIFLPQLVAGDIRLGTAQHIVVYSGGWSDSLSRAAGKRLLALGYQGVTDFRGGLDSWKSAGRMLAVVRDENAATPESANTKPE